MVIHGDEHVAYMSFFRAQPPVLSGQTLEQMKESLVSIKTVKAQLVAQLVIPRARMVDFAKAMTRQAEAYQSKSEPNDQHDQHIDQ